VKENEQKKDEKKNKVKDIRISKEKVEKGGK